MSVIDIAALLSPDPDRPGPGLAGWYAQPIDRNRARALLQTVEADRQALLKAGGTPPFRLALAELIAGYWSGRQLEMRYDALAASPRTPGERALLDLIAGQLLISCKRDPARRYLRQGFDRAAPLLLPRDYFTVMRRHLLLGQLPLSARGGEAQNLQQLLDEARVIERLRGGHGKGRNIARNDKDTLG